MSDPFAFDYWQPTNRAGASAFGVPYASGGNASATLTGGEVASGATSGGWFGFKLPTLDQIWQKSFGGTAQRAEQMRKDFPLIDNAVKAGEQELSVGKFLGEWFDRAAVVMLGFIFVAVGLWMLKGDGVNIARAVMK